jgi:putative addiction module component (TIGR02574 family)
MKDFPISKIDQLSVQERLWIVENIWASIADQPDSVEMPDWHKRELERRLDSHKNNPEGGSTWAEVKKRILG